MGFCGEPPRITRENRSPRMVSMHFSGYRHRKPSAVGLSADRDYLNGPRLAVAKGVTVHRPGGRFIVRPVWLFPPPAADGRKNVPLRLGRRGPSYVRGETGVSKNRQPSPPRKSGTVPWERLPKGPIIPCTKRGCPLAQMTMGCRTRPTTSHFQVPLGRLYRGPIGRACRWRGGVIVAMADMRYYCAEATDITYAPFWLFDSRNGWRVKLGE
jgi:hypothetical protein